MTCLKLRNKSGRETEVQVHSPAQGRGRPYWLRRVRTARRWCSLVTKHLIKGPHTDHFWNVQKRKSQAKFLESSEENTTSEKIYFLSYQYFELYPLHSISV